MKRFGVFTLLLLIWSCTQKSTPPTEKGKLLEYKVSRTRSDKPQAPIDLDITCESPPRIGESAKLIFSATPQIDADDFTIRVILPKDVTYDGGEQIWRGSVVKGYKKELSVSCTIPDNKKREIIVTAVIDEGKTKHSKTLSMTVGSEEENKPEMGKLKKGGPGGQDVYEYELPSKH